MEIRKAAYELCKAMVTLPAREQITHLIRGLHNTHLNYLAHQQFAQALGYLIINQEREQLARRPSPVLVESLQEDHLKCLAGLHKQFTDLNEKCIKALNDALPNCTAKAISPYNRFNYTPPAEITEVEMLPQQQADDIVSAFQRHPQIEVAIQSSSVLPPTFSPEHYMQHIWDLEEGMKQAGTREVPLQVKDIDRRLHKDSPQRTFIRHIAAVTSLRASLSVLNQMIYQKIFQNKLLVIDESNTIKFGSFGLSTGGSSVVYQHAGLLYIVEVGDIILVKTILLNEPFTMLCRVELLDPHIPLLHFGEPRYAELREVDENLNPYARLFRAL